MNRKRAMHVQRRSRIHKAWPCRHIQVPLAWCCAPIHPIHTSAAHIRPTDRLPVCLPVAALCIDHVGEEHYERPRDVRAIPESETDDTISGTVGKRQQMLVAAGTYLYAYGMCVYIWRMERRSRQRDVDEQRRSASTYTTTHTYTMYIHAHHTVACERCVREKEQERGRE